LALLAFSGFQAWLDQYTSAEGRLVVNANLQGQLESKDGQLASKDREISQLRRELEAKPKIIHDKPRGGAVLHEVPSAPAPVISNMMVEVIGTCYLQNPMKVPEDLVLVLGDFEKTSYLSGISGKSYLHSISSVSYKKAEEEGKAYVIQKYDLPPSSDLIGEPVSKILEYNQMQLHLWGADGKDFDHCVLAEITMRINGVDVYRRATALKGDHIEPHSSLGIIIPLVNLKVP
jgi:hypothetical protein